MLDDAKAKLLERATRLLDTPVAKKLLADERVMKVLIGLVSARGKIRRATDEQIARIAKRLKLATREDVRDLRKTLEKLQQTVDRATTTKAGGSDGG